MEMRVLVRLLEEQAERSLMLAYRCQSKRAEKIMRALAVDLALGAEHYRHSRVATVTDQLADLSRLARLSQLASEIEPRDSTAGMTSPALENA